MDPYDSAPRVASISATHAIAAIGPESTPVASIPPLASGVERFATIDDVVRRVRQLHEVMDPDVTPHKSKYAARIIMVRQQWPQQQRKFSKGVRGRFTHLCPASICFHRTRVD
jgi:hypothetical protein